MAEVDFAALMEGNQTSLSPAEIERELSSMWKPINEKQGSSVSRVVLGNVIWLGDSERVPSVMQSLMKVVPKFPARIFLVERQPDNESEEIVANVTAQCFLPHPGQPVCCEMIHLRFGPRAAKHVRGCVAPLLLADIQTLLWTSFTKKDFPQLTDLQQHVDRTIHQASLCDDPVHSLQSCVEEKSSAFDLSWFRMNPIREQVTAFFDDPANGFRLDEIAKVKIVAVRKEQLQSLPQVMSAMFVGWIAARLKWKAVGPTATSYNFQSTSGEVEVILEPGCVVPDDLLSNLSTIEMQDRAGTSFKLSLGPVGMDLYCQKGKKATGERHLLLHELEEAEALGMALNSPAKARYFREAAAAAAPVLQHFIGSRQP